LCFFIGRVWVSSVVDLPVFLSLGCRNGLFGLRETHAGRSQLVSVSSTEALFSFSCGCNLGLCFIFFVVVVFVFFIAVLRLWVWM